MGVAITKQDFIDLAKLVDGVSKAKAEYECGRKLIVYISPDNGATADSNLIQKYMMYYIRTHHLLLG